MSPNTKERLIHSVAGGVIIPSLYFVGIAIVDVLNLNIASEWIVLPILWPAFVFKNLLGMFADDFWFFTPEATILVVAANFVLYSLLTYAVIRLRQRMPPLR